MVMDGAWAIATAASTTVHHQALRDGRPAAFTPAARARQSAPKPVQPAATNVVRETRVRSLQRVECHPRATRTFLPPLAKGRG